MSSKDQHIEEQQREQAKPPAYPAAPQVYKSIVAVMAAIGKEGIAKSRSNTQQGYKFRGIDDVYNAISPILAENNLLIVPTVQGEQRREGQTKNGGALFYVTLRIQYDIISAIDGSRITAIVSGEAMDSADKATNKALSAAYKYMCMQVFCIPTEGDNDADSHTHEVKSMTDPYTLSYSNPDDISQGVNNATSRMQLAKLFNANQSLIESLPDLKQAFSDKKSKLPQ